MLPLSPTQRAHVPGLQPALDALQVEAVVARAPGDGHFRHAQRLVVDARLIQRVPADGAVLLRNQRRVSNAWHAVASHSAPARGLPGALQPWCRQTPWRRNATAVKAGAAARTQLGQGVVASEKRGSTPHKPSSTSTLPGIQRTHLVVVPAPHADGNPLLHLRRYSAVTWCCKGSRKRCRRADTPPPVPGSAAPPRGLYTRSGETPCSCVHVTLISCFGHTHLRLRPLWQELLLLLPSW